MLLFKCLKCPFLEHPMPVNVVTACKHCRDLHGSTFILFFHHSEIYRVGKRLDFSGLQSWDCFLTH